MATEPARFSRCRTAATIGAVIGTIPLARGASRNLPVADLVREAEAIATKGQREIVLTGINVGDFGRTTGESFIDLLRALDAVEGIDRYRISSIEPNLLTDEVIAFTAGSDKFQPHFHVPLQSGCDRILALMAAGGTTPHGLPNGSGRSGRKFPAFFSESM